MADIEKDLSQANDHAHSMFQANLDNEIAEFKEDELEPWNQQQRCATPNDATPVQESICDLSAMKSQLVVPGQSPSFTCSMLFFCGDIAINANKISLVSDSIWVATGTFISTASIPGGENGATATSPGGHGGNGVNGLTAASMDITANTKLRASDGILQFTSKGGDGGNGGDGAEGQNNMGNMPWFPHNANEVVANGVQYDYAYHETGTHCGGHCHTQEEYWYYSMDIITDACCGGVAGNGGNGGDAGAAGILTITGTSGVAAKNQRLSSAGGSAGRGGNVMYGQSINHNYKAWHHKWEDAGCHGFGGLSCGPSYPEQNGGYTEAFNDVDCYGAPGSSGANGNDWSA